MREGQTVVGGMATSVHRDLGDDALASRVRSRAFAGGVDFSHDWSDRKWSLSGFAASSHIVGSSEVISAAQRSSARYYQRPDAGHLSFDSVATSLSGYSAQVALERAAGEHWRGDVNFTTTSPGYEINDLGFQSRADEHFASATVEYVHEEPGRILREWNVEGGPRGSWNYDGNRTGTRLNVEGFAQFLNYWDVDFEVDYVLPVLNDRLTRGGPLFVFPQSRSRR